MADHPPEDRIRQGENAVKKADPHGLGQQGAHTERPAAMPTDARHDTETAAHQTKTDK